MSGLWRRGYLDPGTGDWSDSEQGTTMIVPADAIVIERGDLPEVYVGKSVVAGPVACSPREPALDVYRKALAYLALAEYLSVHPPVDEALVAELAAVIRAHAYRNAEYPINPGDTSAAQARAIALAREAVEQGWTKPGATS